MKFGPFLDQKRHFAHADILAIFGTGIQYCITSLLLSQLCLDEKIKKSNFLDVRVISFN